MTIFVKNPNNGDSFFRRLLGYDIQNEQGNRTLRNGEHRKTSQVAIEWFELKFGAHGE